MKIILCSLALAILPATLHADPTPTLSSGERCPRDSNGLTQACFCISTGGTVWSDEVCE